MSIKQIVLSFVFFLVLAQANQCLNHQGVYVDWWVKLIFPGTVAGGFAYFDSTYAAPSFALYNNQADSQLSPLSRTLRQINQFRLSTIAWNDQKPNGTTSSVRAHSKGVLSFNQNYNRGFLIVHSMPQYPAFINQTVNITINDSQKIYGQHAFCLSVDNITYYDLISRILPIRPFLYAENFNNGGSLANLIQTGKVSQPDYTSFFTYKNHQLNTHNMKFIFKNGGINASIFQDGLNNYLQSPLLAETWGRPLLQPWCGSPYNVGNLQLIKFSEQTYWTTTKDHSKWTYATQKDFSCFGDMNRMASQWKRGGAFYCINSALLKSALASITGSVVSC